MDRDNTKLDRDQLVKLTDRLKAGIDAYCEKAFDDGPRSHLGASLIGHKCARHLWYGFRWVKYKKHTARMLRLFRRGHIEEARFIEYLRGAGAEVHDVNPDDGQQFRVKAIKGHFGGSMDGQGKLRFDDVGFHIPPMLLEFKTSGTGAGFNDLEKKGVKLAKPQHYMQMCTYGKFYGFHYSIYMCVNKNDDSLHVEIVELDWSEADDGQRKAEAIIEARRPPQKIAANPAYFDCKMCDHIDVCHGTAPYDVNCRSCAYAVPIEGGAWFCEVHNGTIPKDYLPKACGQYVECR